MSAVTQSQLRSSTHKAHSRELLVNFRENIYVSSDSTIPEVLRAVTIQNYLGYRRCMGTIGTFNTIIGVWSAAHCFDNDISAFGAYSPFFDDIARTNDGAKYALHTTEIWRDKHFNSSDPAHFPYDVAFVPFENQNLNPLYLAQVSNRSRFTKLTMVGTGFNYNVEKIEDPRFSIMNISKENIENFDDYVAIESWNTDFYHGDSGSGLYDENHELAAVTTTVERYDTPTKQRILAPKLNLDERDFALFSPTISKAETTIDSLVALAFVIAAYAVFQSRHSYYFYQKHGKRTMKNGCYEGELLHNKFEGTGTFTWKNGDMHQGEWKQSQRQGKGLFTSENGTRIEGCWKDDKLHGKATVTYGDGRSFARKYERGVAIQSCSLDEC